MSLITCLTINSSPSTRLTTFVCVSENTIHFKQMNDFRIIEPIFDDVLCISVETRVIQNDEGCILVLVLCLLSGHVETDGDKSYINDHHLAWNLHTSTDRFNPSIMIFRFRQILDLFYTSSYIDNKKKRHDINVEFE